MEVIGVIRRGCLPDQFIELMQHPAVEASLWHVQRIVWLIVIQIAQQVSQRVADLPILVAKFPDELRAGRHVALVVV